MIKAVILDLDDTFYLTEQATFDMENEALVSMGRSPMKREAHRANWGKPLFEAILERSPDIDVEAFRVAYKPTIKHYTEEGKLDSTSPENLQALRDLKDLGKA